MNAKEPNYQWERIKWLLTKWLFLIGAPFVILILTEWHAGLLSISLDFAHEHTFSQKQANQSPAMATGQYCIDGNIYDNPKAPIYHGAYKKEAKALRDYIRPILHEKGYESYIDLLVSICYVESRFGAGDANNWMQVRGYQGKSGKASVKAGINHFIAIIEHDALPADCDDISILIQSYNYGSGYLTYAMKHGGKDSRALRLRFQALQGGHYGYNQYAPKVLSYVKGQSKE
ncbi:MAG: lysozyme family protein [Lachnospiraceae bacterium]|nr:lysozyme family protein [Lachnospiraceae bacterium]